MNTTLLFAELLIIGLQAGVWLFFLLFLSIFGLDWLQTLQATKLTGTLSVTLPLVTQMFLQGQIGLQDRDFCMRDFL
jgi:hypothetical protein